MTPPPIPPLHLAEVHQMADLRAVSDLFAAVWGRGDEGVGKSDSELSRDPTGALGHGPGVSLPAVRLHGVLPTHPRTRWPGRRHDHHAGRLEPALNLRPRS